MYRGSRHLGKIPGPIPAQKFQLPPLECGTRGHLVAKVGTSKAGGTIRQRAAVHPWLAADAHGNEQTNKQSISIIHHRRHKILPIESVVKRNTSHTFVYTQNFQVVSSNLVSCPYNNYPSFGICCYSVKCDQPKFYMPFGLRRVRRSRVIPNNILLTLHIKYLRTSGGYIYRLLRQEQKIGVFCFILVILHSPYSTKQSPS
jgi:hypothetical protein